MVGLVGGLMVFFAIAEGLNAQAIAATKNNVIVNFLTMIISFRLKKLTLVYHS